MRQSFFSLFFFRGGGCFLLRSGRGSISRACRSVSDRTRPVDNEDLYLFRSHDFEVQWAQKFKARKKYIWKFTFRGSFSSRHTRDILHIIYFAKHFVCVKCWQWRIFADFRNGFWEACRTHTSSAFFRRGSGGKYFQRNHQKAPILLRHRLYQRKSIER